MVTRTGRRRALAILACLVILGSSAQAAGARNVVPRSHQSKAQTLAHVRYIWNGLGVQPPHKKTQKGKKNQALFNQYLLQTQTKQRASIRFRDGTTLHLNQKTDAVLRSPHVTYVKHGEVDEILAPGANHSVQTASAAAAAIGTNFDIKIVGKSTLFIVLHGAVRVKNKKGTVTVKTNQESVVTPNQGPSPPQTVNAAALLGWTNGMPSPNLGENVALDANGGSIAAASSFYSNAIVGDFWRPAFLIDGRLDTGWATAAGHTSNEWVKVKLGAAKTYNVSEVIIDPAATHGDQPSSDLRDFQIRVSTTGTDDASFTTVYSGTCLQQAKLQHFTLTTPVAAKYVELFAVDNYGSPDWISVAEMEVVGKQAASAARLKLLK